MSRQIIPIFVAALMLLAFAACGKEASEGLLTGTINIGPVCPVEPCDQSIDSMYANRELVLSRSGENPIRVPLSATGSFSVSLEPSTYVISMDECDYLGCGQAFPVERTVSAGETVTLNIDIDTGIRSPQVNLGMGALISDLESLGANVTLGESLSQPFFSVKGQEVIVNREVVQVFSYPSEKEARSDADLVDKSGSPIGTMMVSWVAPPHFFLKGDVLVLYVGRNDVVISLLEEALGPQFAGAPVSSKPTRNDVGFTPLDPMSMPEAKAPQGLSTITLPNDRDSIAALFEDLPEKLLGRERVDEDTNSANRIYASYGKTEPVGCGVVGFQAADISTGEFYPAGWTAESVIALFASGADWETQDFGRDGDLFWVNWQTTCSVSPDSSQIDLMEMTTWGNSGSPWVFSATAQEIEGRKGLVAAFVETSG